MTKKKFKFNINDKVQIQYPKGALTSNSKLKDRQITEIYNRTYSKYYKANTYTLKGDDECYYLEHELKLYQTGIEKAIKRIRSKNAVQATKRK